MRIRPNHTLLIILIAAFQPTSKLCAQETVPSRTNVVVTPAPVLEARPAPKTIDEFKKEKRLEKLKENEAAKDELTRLGLGGGVGAVFDLGRPRVKTASVDPGGIVR